jgi:hypothetical protein
MIFFLPLLALQPSSGYGLLITRGFLITHNAPQSVGLLWTSDQLVAETSTSQHKHIQQTNNMELEEVATALGKTLLNKHLVAIIGLHGRRC